MKKPRAPRKQLLLSCATLETQNRAGFLGIFHWVLIHIQFMARKNADGKVTHCKNHSYFTDIPQRNSRTENIYMWALPRTAETKQGR